MEKTMNDAVNVLERFMIVKYSLGEKKETKPGEVLKAIQKTALETPTSPPAP